MTIESISEQFDEQQDDVYVFPVSFAQQRLWFLDQFEPNSPFYNIPVAVQLNGRLHIPTLQNVLNEIVARHEILRTTFETVDGDPVQIIAPTGQIPLTHVDLTHLPGDARQQEALRLANEEAKRPFSLTTGPLFRARLFQLADDDFVALFVMHHIISDGWSIGVLIREISILYDAFAQKRPSPLPDLPIQYADFAHWQREWLQGDVLQNQLDYWTDKLGTDLPVLELPTDRPRPAVQTSRGASHSRRLPPELTAQLKALSRSSGTTLFMTLLAAFHTLLFRYTNQETICVGSPIANRNRGEIEGLIGFFVNTLVLRADLHETLTFRALLAQIKETTLEAYAHQDLPFESLVEAIQPQRDMSHSPLFQVMFILQNAPSGAQALPDLRLKLMDVETGTATFDMTLSMAELGAAGMDASIEFNTDLFNRDRIERLLTHFEVLLHGIVAQPDEAIARLPLLTPKERHQLLVEWNDTAVDYPLEHCVHQLFEQQVERTPTETAVAFQDQSLTYAELNANANQLAHYLCHLGIQPDDHVAICLDKSLEMIVAVLAVLKAGAAYLPIDPAYPNERIRFMLEDAQPKAILANNAINPESLTVNRKPLPTQKPQAKDHGLRATPPPSPFTLHNSQFIILPSVWPQIADYPTTNLPISQSSTSLAYVIYTSGSTGKSKGVMIEHRSLVNAYFAWADAYQLHTVRSHLQMANFAFDVFSGDLVRALLSGGKLVLCPRELLLTPDRLYALMQAQSVDIAEFVPVVLRHLVQYLDDNERDLSFMRLLACGSDNWYVGEYKKFLHFCGPHTRLINSFGLTEATIDSTFFESDLLNLDTEQVVPIGRPFPNMQLYILDPWRQPVPIGVPGELYVGGAGVARGYHNRPELTAEKFIKIKKNELSIMGDEEEPPFIPHPSSLIPHPSSLPPHPSSLMLYKTGDRARYLPDGNVEFLGRIDHQIKIRGFRIEPGEIEAVLKDHPALRQVAVMPVEAAVGDKRLAAYAVAAPDNVPTTGALRRFAQERLPDYMVPAAFVLLDKMPLLANGKVNRRALPPPDWSRRDVEGAYVAPRTPVEETLAAIWQTILGADQIGIHDNFFELGGHSLLATQLVSRVREAFEIACPLRTLFEAPTIAALAEHIEIAQRTDVGPQAPPIQPVPRDQALPLSFAQQRLWFLDQLEPDSPFYNIPEAMRLTGSLDVDVLAQSLNEVVRRHESLRTLFRTVAGRPFQHILPALTLPLPIVDLSNLPQGEREAAARQHAQAEAKRPFTLTTGPLLRARLLRLAVDDHIILLTMHHIISDNWSTNVLIGEVAVLYEAFANGRFSPLPNLPIQYADFAHWQRHWLQGEVLDTQLDYWRDTLAGSPTLLALPTDRPRPVVQTFNGHYLPFTLSRALSNDIQALCRQERVTPFMFLLAAFQTLLYRYTSQTHINIGSPIANRSRADIENLIGFFVNTLVFTSRFSDDLTFRTFLQQQRETALGAYAHQDLPFEMIVDAVQPDRNLSHSPLFQVMFVTQNSQMQETQQLPQLTIRPVEAHSGTAKFDLTLFMLEEEDQLTGAWEFNTDLFDAVTIERMSGHFTTLLQGITANPDALVIDLPLLTAAERHQLLVEWNDTAVPFPDQLCVHHLFEQQVERTPRNTAVRFQQKTLSYTQLNAKANQLAHHLIDQGVGPASLVGICMTRTPDLIVALLATLKAGGAYIPIDPTYPTDRIRFMIEDAQPRLIFTIDDLQLRIEESAFPNRQSKIVNLKSESASIANYPTTNLPISQSPDSLAYIIYTSGSTGKPKGTMLTHRGVVNYLTWCQHAYPIYQGNGSPVHSSISFDLTVTSLLAPLISGQCVHLLPEEEGIALLADALRNNDNYSLVKITPAHLELLSRQMSPDEVAGKTHGFIIGGENLSTETLAFWQTHTPDTILINEYGPTETVVGCCTYQVPANERGPGSVPIGMPIHNTQLYILDKHQKPVPIGVPGELYIGGVQVGRGYLNRPQLTAEKFIEINADELEIRNNETQSSPILYKTGDLVKRLPGGNIVFLGRLDHQVKIHGFRIELGEIEAVLRQHPAPDRVVVIDREDTPGQKRLVAYITLRSETTPDVKTLRDFLQETLPDYMIPAAFVFLDTMPLTANGKVDRDALPTPDATRPKLGTAYTAPRSDKEQILADIWSGLLGVDEIGVHDSFFELGGDSILSIQVVARANQAGLHLTPRHIFQYPTIAGLAAVSGSGLPIQAAQGVVTGDVPLTPIQRWFFAQEQPQPHHWNQSLMLTVPHTPDVDLLKTAVFHLIKHHDALRLRFTRTNSSWEQHNADLPDSVPLTHIDLSQVPVVEQTAVLEAHANQEQASANLDSGCLLRVVYFTMGHSLPDRLLIIVHHLAMDGVSWRILLEDLQTAYQQLSQQQPVQLPAKTTAFRDWARQLNDFAQSEALKEEVAYWTAVTAPTPLPRDKAAPEANLEGSAETVTVCLTAAETEALLRDVPDVYHTEINDLLLTALAQALGHWLGETAVTIHLEGHGREPLFDDVDLSRTVGWFTTLSPVRLNLTGINQPGQAIMAIKEQLRELPRRGIGFGLLRWLCHDTSVAAAMRQIPLPEISFNYLGQMDQAAGDDASFGPAPEAGGLERSPQAKRTHLLEIDGGIMGNRLEMVWTYSKHSHHRETISRTATHFIEALRALIKHCQSPEAGGVTLSDVADFGWDQDDLDDILNAIEQT